MFGRNNKTVKGVLKLRGKRKEEKLVVFRIVEEEAMYETTSVLCTVERGGERKDRITPDEEHEKHGLYFLHMREREAQP